MATKPTALPTWATDLSNNTEPSSGQKASGWTVEQVPPSSYFNWWMYTAYLWSQYLDELHSETVTVVIGAEDFVADTGAGLLHQDGYLYTSGVCKARASLKLPVGYAIQTAAIRYEVDGGSVRGYLKRVDITTGTIAAAIWDNGSADNTGTSNEAQTSGTLNHTVLANNNYYIEVDLTGASNTNKLWGAIVTYTRPTKL